MINAKSVRWVFRVNFDLFDVSFYISLSFEIKFFLYIINLAAKKYDKRTN